ncbi:MAG TPA: 2-hydroxyacid dehydrogenase [Cyclobacteriaceae bacterium]|nr:2-hydroxyacid dehydrogenase [Cyclobacteriaceae bacterium]
MKVAVYSTHLFERQYLLEANKGKHDLILFQESLNFKTTSLAEGCEAVCLFVNDDASKLVLDSLYGLGIRFIALRSAGFNNVDLKHANEIGIRVANVPGYSPYAVAEHTVAMMLALNRKIISAHNRIMELNFSLDGLVGFDMNNKTVGIIGTGKIGCVVAKIINGFSCRILAFDQQTDEDIIKEYNVLYVDLPTLCRESDIITLHVPLLRQTRHMINTYTISLMRQGVMLINTSRGALVQTNDVINGLKTRRIGSFGMDVYEEEASLFFQDHSDDILQDDVIARLLSFRNVLITGHQAFLTREALQNIARSTMANLDAWAGHISAQYELS